MGMGGRPGAGGRPGSGGMGGIFGFGQSTARILKENTGVTFKYARSIVNFYNNPHTYRLLYMENNEIIKYQFNVIKS